MTRGLAAVGPSGSRAASRTFGKAISCFLGLALCGVTCPLLSALQATPGPMTMAVEQAGQPHGPSEQCCAWSVPLSLEPGGPTCCW